MRITTLIENSAHPMDAVLEVEHGLSFFIEYQGHVLMSDLGATAAFAENAVLLGVDLALVEAVTISHHHYDHGGGLARFIMENAQADVYLRRCASTEFIAQEGEDEPKQIGLDQTILKASEERIVYVDRQQEILPGVHVLTHIPVVHTRPSGDTRLKMVQNGEIVPDSFDHEMVTILEEKSGLVVLTGCAHSGVLNMIEAVRQAFPGKPISAVIGGFHLRREKPEDIRKIGETLVKMDIPAIYTGQCTGAGAMEILELVLGGRFYRLHTGLIISIE